jgi:hypothetical protein
MIDGSGSMMEGREGGSPPYEELKQALSEALPEVEDRVDCDYEVELWSFHMARSRMAEAGGWSVDRCESGEGVWYAQAGFEGRSRFFDEGDAEVTQERWRGERLDKAAITERMKGLRKHVKAQGSPRDTPLKHALLTGLARLKRLSDAGGPRVLILVTDGLPDCYLKEEVDREGAANLVPKNVREKRWENLSASLCKAWLEVKDGSDVRIELLTAQGTSERFSLADCLAGKNNMTRRGNSLPADEQLRPRLKKILRQSCAEVCNGKDDDGDEVWDEGLDGYPLRRPSASACGVCAGQKEECVDGEWRVRGPFGCALSRAFEPKEVTCDGLDNDCDGLVDEAPCLPSCKAAATFADVVAVGQAGRWHCSGVLVGPQAVLTARHCLPADEVLVGSSIERPQSKAAVRAAHVYPAPEVDVALLELEQPLDVPYRLLREAGEDQPPHAVLSHVGFGTSNSEASAGFGTQRELLLDAQGWGCTPERSMREGCDPRFELRVGGNPGRDTCAGDSGGALFEFIASSSPCVASTYCQLPTEHPRRGLERRLLGITSRSIAGATVRCGQGGIYTRVDVIRPWIDERLRELARDSCGRQ